MTKKLIVLGIGASLMLIGFIFKPYLSVSYDMDKKEIVMSHKID
ncbi:hypothetical protein OL233_06300 [Vagococcus sp. PNs007]|uniref:Methanol dehydrogenase n=1 Tax=Vagococcus proximus TaxID=2991417 RepID=A0ABT5X1M1_9ENTE|nr:hypothetical protein [Vagococcus fessus]MDF0479900.1 hypothetical protein [Vagococcus proximus]